MVASWLLLWCHLHKIMICSIFVSVTNQPTVQNELREPSRNIYDLRESCSGGTRAAYLMTIYISFILWFSKQYQILILSEFHSRKISRMFVNFIQHSC